MVEAQGMDRGGSPPRRLRVHRPDVGRGCHGGSRGVAAEACHGAPAPPMGPAVSRRRAFKGRRRRRGRA
eukprot:10223023-Heterocapsa_arctica.AAC.1